MKKIQSYIVRTFLTVCLVVGASGCNYLDVVPPETADLSDTMKDKSDAIDFLYSCYSTAGISIPLNTLGGLEASADEYVNPLLWGRLGQVASWDQLSSTYQSNLGIFQLPWTLMYNALGQCNLFEKILSETSPKGVTLSDRERWSAEIKFLKAYYHFRLLEAYGPIPIIDHSYPTDTSKDQLPGRSHFDFCVDKIVGWLDEAAAVLPATVDSNDLGRASSTICKALKSRVLLYAASPLWNGSFPDSNWRNTRYVTPGYGYELVSHAYDPKKWERARIATQEAIDLALGKGNRSLFGIEISENLRQSQDVPLPDIPGVSDDFKKKVMQMRYLMSSAETDGNREVIWGVIADPSKYIHWPFDAFPHNVITSNSGGAMGGICAMSPLLYAVEHFYTASGVIPMHDSSKPVNTWFTSAGYQGREDIINLNDGREPRFYAWLSFDGDEFSSLLYNGQPLIVQTRVSTVHGYNPDMFNRDNNQTGYYLKKWCQPNIAWRPDGALNSRMVPAQLIRLSELYLNLAECDAALGNEKDALVSLNVVRKRAGVRDVTTADFSLMSLTDWIRNERYVELFAEGHRYYDARRWMIAPQVFKSGVREGLNAVEKKDPTFEEFNRRTKVDQPFQWSDRMYLLPIPSSEIYNNPQLVQSQGY